MTRSTTPPNGSPGGTGVRSALVIGAGVAGPVVAMALQSIGVSATIFEAYPTTADGVGGGISLSPNGVDALRAVGAEHAVLRIGSPVTRSVMYDRHGNTVSAFAPPPDLPPMLSMLRYDLYGALRDAAVERGIRFAYGKRLVGAVEAPGQIAARFADGSTATGHVLIGADGIHSTTRGQIDPGAPDPVYFPLLELDGASDLAIPDKSDGLHMVLGEHSVLGHWQLPGGRTHWYANLPLDRRLTVAQAREVPAGEWLRRAREIYAGDAPSRDLIAHTRPEDLCVLGSIAMMPPVPRWYRGRMVLVGDAVHAPSSTSGQGAALALESAVELARCLRDLPGPAAAFAAYERLRRARVETIAARTTVITRAKAESRAATALTDLLTPEPTDTAGWEDTFGFICRHHIDWDSPVEPGPPGRLDGPRPPEKRTK